MLLNEFTLVKLDPSPPLGEASLFIIRLLDFSLIILLIFIFFNKKISFSWIQSLSIFLVFFISMILGAELFIKRFYPSPYENDDEIGWKLKKNFATKLIHRRADGSEYEVVFYTNEHGLRPYGVNKNQKIDILVLGDSFSGATYASNNEMWYSEMTKELQSLLGVPDEYFFTQAGGAGGYGTYQQFLLAQTLNNKLNPDLVIIQFCSNDFTNNTLELEENSFVRNQSMIRPYLDLVSNKSFFRPGYIGDFYRSFMGSSQIFQRVDSLITRIQYLNISEGKIYKDISQELMIELRTNGNLLLSDLDQTKRNYLIQKALKITENIFIKLKKLFPYTPVIIVNCSGADGYLNYHWVDLAYKTGLIPITAPSDFLKGKYEIVHLGYNNVSENSDKKKIFSLFNSDGSHLSDIGNKTYGKILANEILKNEDLKNYIVKPTILDIN